MCGQDALAPEPLLAFLWLLCHPPALQSPSLGTGEGLPFRVPSSVSDRAFLPTAQCHLSPTSYYQLHKWPLGQMYLALILGSS